ncbi:MAG TPA: MMPL family transporter, partial [Chitinophagaceae bacterium]|nr:MMPL family transporter [Chitinophagaceae bacterium]
LPTILSYFPEPKVTHTSYLESRLMHWFLGGIDRIVFRNRPWIYGGTAALIVLAVLGMLKLNSVAYIVDDIPHSSLLYQDLEFFQQQFNGVMPLEILVNTRRRSGIFSLKVLGKLDSLSQLLASKPQFGKPVSVTEGIKFALQAFYGGNPADYRLPNEFELPFIAPYLAPRKEPGMKGSQINDLLSSFMDSTRQIARVSVNMKDIGSRDLAALLASLKPQVNRIFDTSRYQVTFTGTSMIFLEGSRYIINGLKDSILLAIGLILCCMLYLFRSWKMLAIALVPNLIPLVVTAGIMGWAGVHLKPSTVLVFSIALGIAIDVTIRFLINFRQELPRFRYDISATVRRTIHETGLSIVFTGLILIAGFLIFCFSGFEGTRALGWLTSLTLVLAMISNLTLLPALLLWMERHLWKKASMQEPLWSVLEDEGDIDLDRLGLGQFSRPEESDGGSQVKPI